MKKVRKVHFALQEKITKLLLSLPSIHDSESQSAFLHKAGLDAQLRNQIPFGKAPTVFWELLVQRLSSYGQLEDGRDPLEAVLNAAKEYVGIDKRAYCETLIQELHGNYTPDSQEIAIEFVLESIPNLNETDELVLRLSCEYILSTNREIIEPKRLLAEKEEARHVSEDELRESLEILEECGYIKIFSDLGNTLFPYKVTPSGFDAYAQVYLPDYASIMHGMMLLIVNDDMLTNHALTQALKHPQILVDYILEFLEENHLFQLSRMSGAFMRIGDISPQVRRMLKKTAT